MRKGILVYIVIFISFISIQVYADSNDIINPVHQFLNYVNSPQSKALGDCSINLTNEQSALYNPGAYGLFYRDKIFSVSLPSNTKLFPDLSDDFKLKTWSIGAGINSEFLNLYKDSPFKFSIGLAYTRHRLDYGVIMRTDESGTPLGTFKPYDEASVYTFSVSIEYYLQIGLGFSKKSIESKLGNLGGGAFQQTITSEADATDFGLLVQFPIHNFLDLSLTPDKKYKLELTPSVAYTKTNKGDDIYYINVLNADQMPETTRTGFGLKTSVVNDSYKLISLMILYEKEKVLEFESFSRYGFEFGLYDGIFFRIGDNDGRSSYGFGFNLRGWLNFFNVNNTTNSSKVVDYFLTHFDISYDFANISQEDSDLENTKSMKLNFSF